MSTRRGNKPKGGQKYQNKTKFKHNKNSTKTEKILAIVHRNLCKRCHEQIEWRKTYRKYKPLSQPRRCDSCQQKNVKRAYHALCDDCAKAKKVCAKCRKPKEIVKTDAEIAKEQEELMNKLQKTLETLPERKRKTVIRKFEQGDLIINSDDEIDEEDEEDKDEDKDEIDEKDDSEEEEEAKITITLED